MAPIRRQLMKIWVLSFVVLLFSGSALAEPEVIGSLQVHEVEGAGAGVWRIVHTEPVWSNSLLVETADGKLVLCDTPMTEAATVELLVWAEERFGEREWIVLNGHFHPDCTAGNAAMIEAGAEVWASTHTAELLAEQGQGVLDSLAESNSENESLATEFRATRLAGPTRTFDLSSVVKLPIESERIEIIFPGAGHAPDNVVTHFVDRGLVFAGCLCFSAKRETPGYLGAADLEAWPAALQRVKALGATIVIPGHGAPGGPELLGHTADVLRRHSERADADP